MNHPELNTNEPLPDEDTFLTPFAVSELFGPCTCEHDNCNKKTYTIWMKPSETIKIPLEYKMNYIFEHHLGIALCSEHDPNNTQQDQE